MFVSLSSILRDPVFRSAQPTVLAGGDQLEQAQVRWVHPSEVLQIATLLHGNELLLTTGDALFRLKHEAQLAFLESLSQRGVAALVLEPLTTEPQISEEFIARAERLALPLIRLQARVPFVELAEKINRRILSDQAATLRQADEVSQSLARHIASAGPNLRPLMDLISEALGVRALLVDLSGHTLAESTSTGLSDGQPDGPAPGDWATSVATDLFVGSDVAAQLVLQGDADVRPERLEVIAERLGSIVGLAYAQHHRPSAVQLANTSLLQAIVNGAGEHFIANLARQAELEVDQPLCLMVFQGYDMSRIRSGVERALHLHVPQIRTYLEGNRLYALQPLHGPDARGTRAALVETLRRALAGISVECCVGPVAPGIAQARRSLSEALLLEGFAGVSGQDGRVRDAADYALERLAVKLPDTTELEDFVAEQLNGLLQADAQRGGQLVTTLLTWLDAGCNTTQTAARLYLERQTLHKRLSKILTLLGDDPRESGRVLPVHLACRIAAGLPHA